MKKITLAYFILAGLCVYITISGYKTGAGTNGYDCTGAETGLGNPTGCKTCHGSTATSAISVVLELDSTGGVPTTHYTGGKTYTVKITGTNNSTTSLPKWGLQVGCIKGSAAATTPVNAGTWSSTCPMNCKYSPAQANNFVVNVVEHSTPLNPTTGTGGNGTTYVESFTWTAPASGTGTISFWGVVNAVNNNGTDDSGDKWNTAKTVITEWPSGTGVEPLYANAELNVFPNPASDFMYLEMKNIPSGNYSLSVYDINGRKIFTGPANAGVKNLNTSGWQPGIYTLIVEGENFKKHISAIKE